MADNDRKNKKHSENADTSTSVTLKKLSIYLNQISGKDA